MAAWEKTVFATLLGVLACSVGSCTGSTTSTEQHETADEAARALSEPSCGLRYVATDGSDDTASQQNDCRDKAAPCKTVQRGVDAACAGDTVRIAGGDYAENVVVRTPLTLAGSNRTTVLRPALSAAAPCTGDDAHCGGAASSVVLVRASGVTIEDLVIDGNSLHSVSEIVRGGVRIDARNGIITDNAVGVIEGLVVRRVVVKNVFLRGIFASTGGSFRFEDNYVKNVQGDTFSIAVFNRFGAGVVTRTAVEDASDAISSNHSRGVTFTENFVRSSESGLHSDNSGDATGSVPDRIEHNVVSDCRDNGYGIWALLPFLPLTVRGNLVVGCDVGLALFGQGSPAATIFEDNVVIGANQSKSIGALVSNDQRGFEAANTHAQFVGNTFARNHFGIVILEDAGYVSEVDVHCNAVTHNVVGLYDESATSRARDNRIEHNTLGARAVLPANESLDARNNYWGCSAGPPTVACDPVEGEVITANAEPRAPRCAPAIGSLF